MPNRFFVLQFQMDEAEYYAQAEDEQNAISQLINHIKDHIGEMSDYSGIEGQPITSWSQIVSCTDRTENLL